MSTSPTKSDLVLLMLKNTLEYNAGITAIAMIYMMSIDSEKYRTRFINEYKRYTKQYMKKQDKIVEDLTKLIDFNDSNHSPDSNISLS